MNSLVTSEILLFCATKTKRITFEQFILLLILYRWVQRWKFSSIFTPSQTPFKIFGKPWIFIKVYFQSQLFNPFTSQNKYFHPSNSISSRTAFKTLLKRIIQLIKMILWILSPLHQSPRYRDPTSWFFFFKINESY